MIKCKNCKQTFEEFYDQRVIWSGDTLKSCPYCRISVYEGDFEVINDENK